MSKYGVVSSTQIAEWFFKGVAKTTALRRIRLLHKGKYLETCVPLDDGSKTFCLGIKGREVLSQRARYTFSNRNTITHDVTISAIRWKLESFNLAKDVTPEFVLKSELFRNTRYHRAKDQLIPDALMVEVIQQNARAVALEVELTVKSEERYRRIFADYWRKDSIYRVWYFVKSWREADRILTMANRFYPGFKAKLWFSVIEEFLASERPVLYSSNLSKMRNLSDVDFSDLKISEKSAQAPAQGVSTVVPTNSEFQNAVNSAKSGANSLSLDTAVGGPSHPDHSPTTCGSGQGEMAGEESKENELEEGIGIKKCS